MLGAIFNGLIDYTSTHFADEERSMTTNAYPGIAEHKAEHALLVKQVIELQVMFNSGKPVFTMEVMKFLYEWLLNHIQGDDKKFGAFLNSKGMQ